MNKKIMNFTLTLLLIFTITGHVLSYQAEVTDISGDKYFPEVKKLIAGAKESITIAMFIIVYGNIKIRTGNGKTK
ncbi:hypothetical protein HY745_12685 [Candidatus Desantisbacteria bacterium]|nr:hypothetical protein [Candidatus Desantisbacteria bacterium]